MSYWSSGLIHPNGGPTDAKAVPFRWSDVRGTTTAEQFKVGQTVDYDLGLDPWFGTAKANNVRPGVL
jgi:hypothetical protein